MLLNLPLAFWTPGPMEMAIIGVVALLLFGKRLPEVGRSMGRGIVEFKRGLKGIGDDIEAESDKPAPLPEPETKKQIGPTDAPSQS
jgi:sec-independent protein translocase protein TatA